MWNNRVLVAHTGIASVLKLYKYKNLIEHTTTSFRAHAHIHMYTHTHARTRARTRTHTHTLVCTVIEEGEGGLSSAWVALGGVASSHRKRAG